MQTCRMTSVVQKVRRYIVLNCTYSNNFFCEKIKKLNDFACIFICRIFYNNYSFYMKNIYGNTIKWYISETTYFLRLRLLFP